MNTLNDAFRWTLETSAQATVLIALVLLVQFVFRRKLPARWRYALGLLIVARLAMPFVPESSLSIFNLTKRKTPPLVVRPVARTTIANTPAIALPPTTVEALPLELSAPPTPEFSATATRPRINLFVVGEILWLAGCIALLTAAAHRYFRFRSASRRWGTVTEPRVLALLGECMAMLEVKREIRVLSAPGLDTPALFGHFRPALLLPVDISSRLGDRELRHIILHELVHLKRGDVLINWAMIILRAFHWFNPLVWLAFRRLRTDQELACDAAVLRILEPAEQREYGNTLIRMLEEFAVARPCPGMVTLVPFFSRKQTIQRRITMIANFKPAGRVAVAASLALLAALGCLTFTRAAGTRPGASETSLDDRDPWGNPYIITTDTNQPNPAASQVRVVAQSYQWQPTESPAQQPSVDFAYSTQTDPQLEAFSKQMSEVERQVKAAEEKVAAERQRLVAAGVNLEGEDPNMSARLRDLRINAENEAVKEKVILDKLRSITSEELRDILPRIQPDPILSSLLQDLQSIETRLTSLKSDYGNEHPSVQQAEAVRKKLEARVDQETAAIMASLQTRLDALKAQSAHAQEQLAKLKAEDIDQIRQSQTYWNLKAEVDRLKRLRDVIYLRLSQERVESQLPRATPHDLPSAAAAVNVPPAVLSEYRIASAKLAQAEAEYDRARMNYPAGSALLENPKRMVEEGRVAKKKLEDFYPQLKAAESPAAVVEPIRISIGKDGVSWPGRNGTVSTDNLTIFLRDATATGQRVSMIIEADRETRFDSLKDLMDAAKSAGITDVTLRMKNPK